MDINTKGISRLMDYLESQYGLLLLGSEIDDILILARQEIELPDKEEIEQQYPTKGLVRVEDGSFKGSATIEMWTNSEIQKGIEWALSKVRNPYPKKL